MLTDIEMLELLAKREKLTSGDPYGASSKRGSYVAKGERWRVKMRECFSAGDAMWMQARLDKLSGCVCVPQVFGCHKEWLFMPFLDLAGTGRVNGTKFW